MKKSDLINFELEIEQIKSSIKMTQRKKSSLKGLGLGFVGDSVKIKCNDSNYGMIRSVIGSLKISKL